MKPASRLTFSCRLRILLSAALPLVLPVLLIGCDKDPTVSFYCPQPAMLLAPAQDTILVGETVQFGITQQHGAISWSSTKNLVASVNQAGVATAVGSGMAHISAVDTESPSHCPSQWFGELVVR